MLRRAFLRRMIFAGLATWFLDLPLPGEASAGPTPGRSVRYWLDGQEVARLAVPDDGQWHRIEMLREGGGRHGSSVYAHDWAKA